MIDPVGVLVIAFLLFVNLRTVWLDMRKEMEEYDYFEEGLADGLIQYCIVEDYGDALDLTSTIYDDMFRCDIKNAASKVACFNGDNYVDLSEEQRNDLKEKLQRILSYAQENVRNNC